MTTAETLHQYIQDNALSWPDINSITDAVLVEICPGISLTEIKNHWDTLKQQILTEYMSEQVAEFVENTIAANQDFIRQYPNFEYEANPSSETLTIYWNGRPVVTEE